MARKQNDYSHFTAERDFVSLLIDLYRSQPVLWDLNHIHYANSAVRLKVMQELVDELKVYKPDYTVDNLRRKINTLRSNFNKVRHKYKAKLAGKPNATPPPLWYYNEMLFLDQENADSRSLHSFEDTEAEASEPEQSEDDQKCFLELELPVSPTTPTNKVDVGDVYVATPKDNGVRHRKTPSKATARPLKKVFVAKRKADPLDSDSDIEQYMTVQTTYYKKKDTREDILVKSWVPKLTNMAPEQRLFAEKIINDVLLEGEMGNLTRNGVSFGSS